MLRRCIQSTLSAIGLIAVLMAITLGCAFSQAAAPKPAEPPKEDAEILLGKENAEANDKEVKLVTDAAMVERVNRIGQILAAVANEEQVPALWGDPKVKKFQYTFKIVDDKDVNAYSLPAGYIYVNKGLLDFVHSDDELAGVLAHEIAHAAHHHMMRLISEQEKIQRQSILPLILLSILVKAPGNDIPSLIMAGQLYAVAKVNTFGIEAEKDSDHTAVHYMMKTKYNPVGILTFMERLAGKERLGPEQELGIYRTHPPSEERAQSLLNELAEVKVAIDRRAVDPGLRADVTVATVNNVQLAEVTMFKTSIVKLVASDGKTAEERAQGVAATLNTLFDRDLNLFEVRASADKTKVIARLRTLVVFTQADADAQKTTIPELSSGMIKSVCSAILQSRFNRTATVSMAN